jgi:hypothetical protein
MARWIETGGIAAQPERQEVEPDGCATGCSRWPVNESRSGHAAPPLGLGWGGGSGDDDVVTRASQLPPKLLDVPAPQSEEADYPYVDAIP